MRSQYSDKYNHDDQADAYDRNVLDENDPIRAGYDNILNWVVNNSGITVESVVLDLGAGTGNLACRLPQFGQLVCVDISQKMLNKAKSKLKDRSHVSYIRADLLEYFDNDIPEFNAILSTYAIHHLTEDEKKLLFQKVWTHLKKGGDATFGDLMFENENGREKIFRQYIEAGNNELVEEINDEFFWDVETAVKNLSALGFKVQTKRFSELSWGILAHKPH